MRHGSVDPFDPGPGVAVTTLAREYPRGFHITAHMHESDQLVYARCGVMRVFSGRTVWVIPPQFALWIPARTPHQIRMNDPVSMRTLYLRSRIAGLRPGCKVLHVRPLLRELIIEIVERGRLRSHHPIESALCRLIIAELRRSSPVPVSVSLPDDPRARVVADALFANPATQLSLRSLCDQAGISVRTLERAFRKEIGTDFESWRRQVRLMKAVEILMAGRKVKDAALSVGYQQSSAFVALFRATFGTTPKAWVAALRPYKGRR